MNDELLEQLESLQLMLIARATGGLAEDHEFREARQAVLADSALAEVVPRFVRTSRTLDQFWSFIKPKFPSYTERRSYIYEQMQPALDMLEGNSSVPSDDSSSHVIKAFDAAGVEDVWRKALSRRRDDPEGAITLARTLLESVCKHILDESGGEYSENVKLPKLYATTAKELNLSPTQHTENIFRQILHGCSSVVDGLGALRNKHSDSHGHGRLIARPSPRHAQLSVNIAGAMAAFLIETWMEKKSNKKNAAYG